MEPATHVSVQGLGFVARHEGFKPCPYKDIAGVPTIGYGETEGVTMKTPCITEREARRNLYRRLNHDYNAAKLLPSLKLRQREVDGLSSLNYNEGQAILTDPDFSNLARRLHTRRARHSYRYRCRIYKQELPKWDVAGGQHSEGLANRRRDEIRLLTRGKYR